MRSIATNDTADSDYGIHKTTTGQFCATIYEFKTTGHLHDRNGRLADTMLEESAARSFQKFVGNMVIPFCYNDPEAHLRRIRNIICCKVKL